MLRIGSLEMNVKLLLILECLALWNIILVVNYTEIDWKAYIDEVDMFLVEELDYKCIYGRTGPLVYPAGFVWLFIALRFFTRGGIDINMAQYIFLVVYLASLGMALGWYRAANVPLLSTLCLFCSKRIRSLYVLRLFNDCWATFFAFLAVVLLASSITRRGPSQDRFGKVFLYNDRRWYMGCLLMSVGISIKMNICLFLPGLLCILWYSVPFANLAVCGLIGAMWQIFSGFPFISSYQESYLHKAFELSRVFNQRWSVNYQFLSTEVFESPLFHFLLFVLMIIAFGMLWVKRWAPRCRKVAEEANAAFATKGHSATEYAVRHTSSSHAKGQKGTQIHHLGNVKGKAAFTSLSTTSFGSGSSPSSEMLPLSATNESTPCTPLPNSFPSICLPHVLTLLESNLVGFAFSRSMHYQFYTWIFFSTLFALHYTKLPTAISIALFAAIEYGFETFPPTPLSSAVTTGGFFCTVFSILFLGDEKTKKYKTGERWSGEVQKIKEQKAIPPTFC